MKEQYLELPDAPRSFWLRHPEALVQTACRFCTELSLQSGEATANAKRLLEVLAFEPEGRALLRVTADGPDEEPAMEAVCTFFDCEEIIPKKDEENKKSKPGFVQEAQ